MKKIVIVARVMPTEMGNSENIRLFRMIRMLSEKYSVYVYAQNADYGVSSIKTLHVQYGLCKDFSYQLEPILEAVNPDLVIFSRWLMADDCIDMIHSSTYAKIAIDIPSITFDILEQRKEIGDDIDVDKYKKNELDVYGKADVLITTTKKNKKKLQESLKQDIVVIPPIEYFDEYPRFTKNVDINSLYFIGDFKYYSNLDALKWIYHELWGFIKKTLYDVKLNIFGKFIPLNYVNMPDYDISVHGFLPTLEEYFEKMVICMAPIRVSSGLHGKIIEAIKHCIPVITTSKVSENFKELGIKSEDLFIADSNKEWVDKINLIISQPDNAYEKMFETKKILSKKLSPTKVKLELFEMIEKYGCRHQIEQGDLDEFKT